jgi:hypothetical protein
MSEERAAGGPNVVLTDQLIDALHQAYQAFLEAHPGEVSPATATNGVLAATAKLLIIVHGHANPDEEELVSWDVYKDACVADLARLLSEPQHPGGGTR